MNNTSRLISPLTLVVVLNVLTQLPKVMAEEFQYVGNNKCIACHRPEYQSWQKDSHALALDDLKPGIKVEAKAKAKLDPKKDFTTDASCLVCHSVGYGKPAAPGADLTNVGCESCHGPGGIDKSLAAHAGLTEPTERVCITCHNAKSPTWKGFVYKKMIESVQHTKQP